MGHISNRKEARFRVSEGHELGCHTTVSDDDIRDGAVIDVSSTGMRIRCEGTIEVGATFTTELKTDRTHGVYAGVVRRVEPWVGGHSILGCQLDDPIPPDVLEELACAGMVNRRADDRVTWNQPAAVSWQLQPGEVDVEILDYSPGGMRVYAETSIPDHVHLRIRVQTDGQGDVVVAATSVWKEEDAKGCCAGLEFNHREDAHLIEAAHQTQFESEETPSRPAIRFAIAGLAAVVLLSVALLF